MSNQLLNNQPVNSRFKYYYLKTPDGKFIFDMVNNEPVYKKDPEGNEVYPEENGEQLFIDTSHGPMYAKDARNREFYPKDKNGNDKPILILGVISFAKDSKGNQYYPQNADGSDQYHGHFARSGNKIIYPLDKNEFPVYRKDIKTGDEVYEIDEKTGLLEFGKDGDGNEVYAKNFNGDEMFAGPLDKYAKDKNQNPIYPVTKQGSIIFPKNAEGDEYYLQDENEYDIYHSRDIVLPRYAKNRYGDEIYPLKKVDFYGSRFSEEILNEKYAQNRQLEPIYPCDGYGNEYIMKLYQNETFMEKECLPISYPITNDDNIIIPKISDKPYFISNDTLKLTEKNILGQIFRDQFGFQDYLTNVESRQRHSRSWPREYKFLPKGALNPVIMNMQSYSPPNATDRRRITKAINPPKIPNTVNPPPNKNSNFKSFIWIVFWIIIFLFIYSLFKKSKT